MKVEILIVSYAKDIPYLVFCLKSISKFASGFSGVTIVVPAVEGNQIAQAIHGITPFKLREYDRQNDPVKWQIEAQYQKCMADQWCPDADYILHTDSDCIFSEPVAPVDYLSFDKPMMMIEAFSRLPGNPWQEPTERALGMSVRFETMRCHPQVNPKGVYHDMRKRVEIVNGCSFKDYVMACKPTFPWGFSEHATIGAFAYYHPKWNQEYRWVEIPQMQRYNNKILQYWSHAAPDQMHDLPSGGRGRPMDDFKRLGLC